MTNYTREVISIVRFDYKAVDSETIVDKAKGVSIPLVLSKVNKNTILGKLIHFKDERTDRKVFTLVKQAISQLPNKAEINNWLIQCRDNIKNNWDPPILILLEREATSYELQYSLVPTIEEAKKELDFLINRAYDWAELEKWSQEKCQKEIIDRESAIYQLLDALSNDSIRGE